MMNFFKALFSNKETPRVRRLSHPRDLQKGDIIKFRFLDQEALSGQTFEIAIVNTYLYGNLCYPELVLKDREGQLLYLMVEEEDGDEYLALSKKIPKAQVFDFLTEDQLLLFKEGKPGQKISIATPPDDFSQWLSSGYIKSDSNIKGAFIKGDARFLSDAEISRREHFTSHTAEDSSEEFCLELEIYESGEQELCVTVYHDIEAIEEMWPSKDETS
jgi:hypothetical protein